jgi:hypothetical protein
MQPSKNLKLFFFTGSQIILRDCFVIRETMTQQINSAGILLFIEDRLYIQQY